MSTTERSALAAVVEAALLDRVSHPALDRIVDLARGWVAAQPPEEIAAVAEHVEARVLAALRERGWHFGAAPSQSTPALPSSVQWFPAPTHEPDAPVEVVEPTEVLPPLSGRLGAEWFADRILLFQEQQGRQTFGIPGAVSMHLSRHGAGAGNFAVWHPWYMPEHGHANSGYGPFLNASTQQRIGYLCRDVDQANRHGFAGWGIDWEGALLGHDALQVVGAACNYARGFGMATVGVVKGGWQHLLNEHRRVSLDRWASDHLDAICWWDPSQTADGYRRQTDETRRNGYGGAIAALAYPYKGVSPAEDARIVEQHRGIFYPGQRDPGGECKALIAVATRSQQGRALTA